jgi:prephenate dehydratase
LLLAFIVLEGVLSLKIGYLGPKGTFSHEAANKYINGNDIYILCDFNSINDILYAVQNGEIDEAIVPIENSLEGAINATLDMMAFEVDHKIKSELIIPIVENLLVKKGTKIDDIKSILSHPQPLGQCRKYINTKFPDAYTKVTNSTAGAAEEVASANGDCAAIGTFVAAQVYGLDILEKGIQDGDNNLTRFVIISAGECAKRTGRDKTSIVFSTDNKPGSLYRILDIFNLWDINMTRIESRPSKDKLGMYIFFIDIMGHKDDDDVKDALTMIKKKTSFFKLLGSYPEYIL